MVQKKKNVLVPHGMIEKYIHRISGPMLDRIDIHIEVPQVNYEKLELETSSESSSEIKKRVNAARKIQMKRYQDYHIFSNSELTSPLMNQFCPLEQESKKILKKAFEKLNLSARAYHKILKISRTIADLEGEENIQTKHVAEAIQYRSLDRKFWK